ncbi:hypothetical protein OF829_05790 [Sphingomonas sp. LB-2]|uniref:hypothetical protein n=1 Tax=Sphingomonas caeni TaxID=2984949 RepID=UPI00223249BF|nr:hypothetical protein [Sphingomonas caeni]MCW3846743.1 hypothetical protein [Sphingomonas caeni]
MVAFTLALALTLSAPAAQDPALEKDARCVVAMQGMSDQIDDPEAKNALNGIMFFFLGRMSARLAPNQMEGAINDAGEALPKDQYREVGLDCVEQMRVLSGAVGASAS